jgi:hypothetical protein
MYSAPAAVTRTLLLPYSCKNRQSVHRFLQKRRFVGSICKSLAKQRPKGQMTQLLFRSGPGLDGTSRSPLPQRHADSIIWNVYIGQQVVIINRLRRQGMEWERRGLRYCYPRYSCHGVFSWEPVRSRAAPGHPMWVRLNNLRGSDCICPTW